MKILSFLLLVSIGGNIALGSWMMGVQAAGVKTVRQSRIDGFRELAAELPADRREAVTGIVMSHRQELRPDMEEIAAARRHIRSLLEQEDIDLPALEQAFAELRGKTAAAQEKGHEMMLEIVPQIPATQRRAFLDKKSGFKHW